MTHYPAYQEWRCWGLNPGPHTCEARALPLSYIPTFSFRMFSGSHRIHICLLLMITLTDDFLLNHNSKNSQIVFVLPISTNLLIPALLKRISGIDDDYSQITVCLLGLNNLYMVPHPLSSVSEWLEWGKIIKNKISLNRGKKAETSGSQKWGIPTVRWPKELNAMQMKKTHVDRRNTCKNSQHTQLHKRAAYCENDTRNVSRDPKKRDEPGCSSMLCEGIEVCYSSVVVKM